MDKAIKKKYKDRFDSLDSLYEQMENLDLQ